MVWRVKKRSEIRAAHMSNFREFFGCKKVPNARTLEKCGSKKVLDESFLRLLGHKNNREQ